MSIKLLVTGGAGFIGSNFIYYQLENHPNDEVLCLDKLTYCGSLDVLQDALSSPNISFIKGDISDKKQIADVFERFQPDVVINFAAESHVDRSIANPGVFLQTNILGTQVLMDACLEYGIERYHQVSTDEVYGQLPLNRPDLLFSEEYPLKPSSPYAASKASADLLVQAYRRTFGLNTSISRCSNNYGPHQFPEKLIPLMIMKALQGENLPVYGDGKNVRDWLHVKDHCSAVDMIIRHGHAGEIYNIGGQNERNNLEIVGMILDQMGESTSRITFVHDRLGHDLRYGVDATKIFDQLGWQPTISFDDGMRDTIAWYLHRCHVTKSLLEVCH